MTQSTARMLAGSWIALLPLVLPFARAADTMAGATASASQTLLTGTVTNTATAPFFRSALSPGESNLIGYFARTMVGRTLRVSR